MTLIVANCKIVSCIPISDTPCHLYPHPLIIWATILCDCLIGMWPKCLPSFQMPVPILCIVRASMNVALSLSPCDNNTYLVSFDPDGFDILMSSAGKRKNNKNTIIKYWKKKNNNIIAFGMAQNAHVLVEHPRDSQDIHSKYIDGKKKTMPTYSREKKWILLLSDWAKSSTTWVSLSMQWRISVTAIYSC